MTKLGTLHGNFVQYDPRPGGDRLDDSVDPGIEAEDQSGVRSIENQVAAGEEDLTGSGDGGGDERVLFVVDNGCSHNESFFFLRRRRDIEGLDIGGGDLCFACGSGKW
jgi:hypothetical protein